MKRPSGRRQRHGRSRLRRADSQAHPKFEITIFGDETHVNYNRILLSVLAGEKSGRRDHHQRHRLVPVATTFGTRLGVRIIGDRCASADRHRRRRQAHPYDKLILATGSSAFIPPITASTRRTCTLPHPRRHAALLASAAKGLKAVVSAAACWTRSRARAAGAAGCDGGPPRRTR